LKTIKNNQPLNPFYFLKMAQSELSLQQNPNFSNIQDLASTNDHYESEKKNIDSIFVLKDSINNGKTRLIAINSIFLIFW